MIGSGWKTFEIDRAGSFFIFLSPDKNVFKKIVNLQPL